LQVDWGVQSLPNLVFIHNGKVVNRLTKADPAEFARLLGESKAAIAAGSAQEAEKVTTEGIGSYPTVSE